MGLKFFKTATILLMLAGYFVACSTSKEIDVDIDIDEEIEGKIQKISVPFTGYSTDCKSALDNRYALSDEIISTPWMTLGVVDNFVHFNTNLNFDDTVIIINSNSELEKYFVGEDEDYPDIDFSTQTLLLANGATPQIIWKLSILDFQQTAASKYELDVEIIPDAWTMRDFWAIALITDKIDSSVTLTVHYKY
ncbi:MAG: hypothetical protein FWE99_03330 [Bacteroidales bacterium]|nr:hypothetical protein [Bacteroidales bacterium]